MRESEEIVQRFHATHTGTTPVAFAHGRTTDGTSSYDRLAQIVPPLSRRATVLDLACGDGYLLELLLRRGQPELRSIGVDMSEAELDGARRRLGGRAELHLGRAQSIPLQDACCDFVLSHMAIFLMDDLPAVASEIRRVLKPGGVFSSIVGRGTAPSPAFEIFSDMIRDVKAREPNFVSRRLGDIRSHSNDGLRTVFSTDAGFDGLVFDEFDLHFADTADRFLYFLMSKYDIARMSLETRTTFQESFRSELVKFLDDDEKIRYASRMIQLTCKAG